MLLHIDNSNFNEVQKGRVLLDFYADWCGPCKMIGPILDQIAKENPEYMIGKINVDNAPDLAAKFQVMSIPTLIVLEDGQEVQRSVGAISKAKILGLFG